MCTTVSGVMQYQFPVDVAWCCKWMVSLCTPGDASARAWVSISQGDDVFPVPGTRNPKHVEDNVAAFEFSKTLTVEEVAELEAAVPAAQVGFVLQLL